MMKLFAALPFWLQITIILAIVGGVVGGYEAWHYSVYKEGATAQKVLDDAVLAKRDVTIGELRQSLKTSQGDLLACGKATERQNDGIDDLKKKSATALAISNAEKLKAQMKAAEHAQEVKRLQGIAAAAPKVDQSCAEALSKTDTILRDSAKDRRK